MRKLKYYVLGLLLLITAATFFLLFCQQFTCNILTVNELYVILGVVLCNLKKTHKK